MGVARSNLALLAVVAVLAGHANLAACREERTLPAIQSRHLLEIIDEPFDPFIMAESSSAVSGMGGGLGGGALAIGTGASTDASSVIDPVFGVETNMADANTYGNVDVDAMSSAVDAASSAESDIFSSITGGPTVADGMVGVSADGTATGGEFASTGAGAFVVYQEAPIVSDGEVSPVGTVEGSIAVADGAGYAEGAAGGDSAVTSDVEGEVFLETKEKANDLEIIDDEEVGTFNDAFVQVELDGEAMGEAEGELSPSSSGSYLELGGGVEATAVPGYAQAGAAGSVDGENFALGDVIATQDVSASGDTISFATDNTLAPDQGVQMANAEDAKAIVSADVDASALSEDTEGYLTRSGASLDVHSDAMAESEVETVVEGSGILVNGGGASSTEAVAGGETSAFAIGSTGDNDFGMELEAYTLSSTEAGQDASGESFSETMAENYAAAESMGAGGEFVNGQAEIASMTEGLSVTAYSDFEFGRYEDQTVISDSVSEGYGFAAASAEDTYTGAETDGQAGGDALNLLYTDDVNGGAAFSQNQVVYQVGAEGSGEGFSESFATGDATALAETDGSKSPQGIRSAVDMEATVLQTTNIDAFARGDETLTEGMTEFINVNLQSATQAVNFDDMALAAQSAGVAMGEQNMESTVVGGDADLSMAASLFTKTNGDTGTEVSTDAQLISSQNTEALGDSILTTGMLSTVAFSASAGGVGQVDADEGSSQFEAALLAAQGGGGVLLGGYDANAGSSSFTLNGYSDAGSDIVPRLFVSQEEVDALGTAEAYTNHYGSATGATFVMGGAMGASDVASTTGTADLAEGLDGDYAVGLGVATGSLEGAAMAMGFAGGLPGQASLGVEVGSAGDVFTFAQAEADDVTFGAAEGFAVGEGDLRTYARIGTTGLDTGVSTLSLSQGMLAGEVGSGVDGVAGSMGDFEADTMTVTMAMAGGPNAAASSITSADIENEGGAVSYINPLGLGTVINPVDADGSGYADASPFGSFSGVSMSDSDSEIVDGDGDGFVLEGGFGSSVFLQGGAATDGAYASGLEEGEFNNRKFPGDPRDLDPMSLTAEAEVLAIGFANSFNAVLDVEGNSVDAGIAGGTALGVGLAEAESQIKPGGVEFLSETMYSNEGEEEFAIEIGDTFAASFAMGDVNIETVFIPDDPNDFEDALFVSAFAEGRGEAGGLVSTDNYFSPAGENIPRGQGEAESTVFASFDEGSEITSGIDFTFPGTFAATTLAPNRR